MNNNESDICIKNNQGNIHKIMKENVESGKGELFAPPPHTTWHAGPHQAVPSGYRALAG